MRARHGRRASSFLMSVAMVAGVGTIALTGCALNRDDGASRAQPVVTPTSTPRPGGKLVVGTAAEADGWLPTINRWTPAAYLIARTIYDPLATIDDSGVAQPYLAEAFEHNREYTQWTIRLRPNVVFHDGTKLTSAALTKHFAAAQDSVVTKDAIAYFKATSTPDDLTFVIDLKAPWAHLPVLMASQLGFIPAPSSYGERNKVAASEPMGSGPFKFTSWIKGQRFLVDRNPDYWRRDADGRQLPYLAEIEFHPVPDDAARTAQLQNGSLDVVHTEAYQDVSGFQKLNREQPDGRVRALLDASQGAEAGVVLNTQTGPFQDPDLRLAAAYAIDRQGLVNDLFNGFYDLADGPFTRASKWGSASSYPTYFPERARTLVNDWKAKSKNHQPPVVRLTNIATADSIAIAQRVLQAWTAAGFDVRLDNEPESVGTVSLVKGDYDGVMLRFWDRPDPDGLFHYFISDSIRPDISLNFSRFRNDTVDQALRQARGSDNDSFRREQYQKVWDEFAQDLPILWLFHTRWAIGYQSKVHGIGDMTLPDGHRAEPVTWGNFYLTSVWLG